MKMKKVGLLGLGLVLSVAMAPIFGSSMEVKAQNPIVQTCYTTDPAPMVYGDTLYVYTGHDEDGASYYDMREWRCYSTKDMANWTDHGTVANIATFSWAKQDAWAPQCVERNGKFYLFVPVIQKAGGNAIGVAVSDSPTGPFRDAIGKPLCTGWSYIDPTVYVDSDGQAYLYFGNGNLYYAKLSNSMTSLVSPITKCDNNANSFGYMSGSASSYVEGPWLTKHGNTYYMLYAAGGIPEHIAYSTSSSPTGPWTYRGVIMSSQGGSFTNHSGVVDFKGNSYFFYHNGALPGGSGFARSVCVEQFSYGYDGSIPKMNMTSGVKAIGTLNPYIKQEAETMCYSSGLKTEACGEGTQNVSFIENNDWLKLANVDFGSGAKSFEARVASPYGGRIEIRLGGTSGTLIGTCEAPKTGDWQKYVTSTCNVSGVTGVHDVYFVFKGGSGSLFNFNWWKFTPVNASDATQPTTQPTKEPTIQPTTQPTQSSNVAATNVTEGWYYIKSVSTQKYLTVDAAKAGANVEICTGNGSESQKWKVTNTGDGYFTLTSATGDFMMDVAYGKDEDGANIGIYNGYSGEAQRFVAQKTSTDGIFTIGTKASNGNKVLDVYQRKTADGTNIIQYTRSGATNQQFVFEPIGGQAPVVETKVPVVESKAPVVESKAPVVESKAPVVESKAPVAESKAPTVTPSASGLSLDYSVNSWGSGYQVSYKIKNSGAKVNTWTLKLKKSDVSITSSWNVNIKESGEYYVITPVAWNASIDNGGCVEFGSIGSGSVPQTISYTLE